MLNENPNAPPPVYGSQITQALDYLHSGVLPFTADTAISDIAEDCSKALEEDYCSDEALADALQFNLNCRSAAANSGAYEDHAMTEAEKHGLSLDEFSYYLISIKTIPNSHNLQRFRKYHYLALHIISQIINLGKRAELATQAYEPETAKELELLTRLHAVYRLLYEKETHKPSDPQASSNLLETFVKDFLTRGGKDDFPTRIRTAVANIYAKNPAKFASLSDVDAAKAISDNDQLLDYYFHASTPKPTSVAGERELEANGYLTFVLEAVKSLRA